MKQEYFSSGKIQCRDNKTMEEKYGKQYSGTLRSGAVGP